MIGIVSFVAGLLFLGLLVKAAAFGLAFEQILNVASNCGPEAGAGGLGAGAGAMGTGCSDEDDAAGSSDNLLASGEGIESMPSNRGRSSAYEQVQRMREGYRNATQPDKEPPPQSHTNPSSQPDSSTVKPMKSDDRPVNQVHFGDDDDGKKTDSGEASV